MPLIAAGTVISINENPYPNGYTFDKYREFIGIRRNMINVFRQLSKAFDDKEKQIAILTVQIRVGLHVDDEDEDETNLSENDSPSLLLYYLFDDWYTTYSLVARSQHQYGAQLDKVVRRRLSIEAKSSG